MTSVSGVIMQAASEVVNQEISILYKTKWRDNSAVYETARLGHAARWTMVRKHRQLTVIDKNKSTVAIDYAFDKGFSWEDSILRRDHIPKLYFPYELHVWLGRTYNADRSHNLVGFDIDFRKPGAEAAWEALCKEHGGLPETVCDFRDGGGWHYYFWLPVDFFDGYLAKSKLELFPGVEFLSRAHLLALPPSTGSDRKAERAFVVAPEPNSANVAIVPDSIQAFLKKLLNKKCIITPTKRRPKRQAASLNERARNYVKNIGAAVQGQRGHDQFYYVACRLIHGFNLSVNEALPIIMEYNDKCDPPFSEREVLHKLNSADLCQDGEGKDRGFLANAELPNNGRKGKVGRPTKKEGSAATSTVETGETGGAGESEEDEPQTKPNGRLEILITPNEHEVNDLAAIALGNPKFAPNLYKRSNMLVRVLNATPDLPFAVGRQAGTPFIGLISEPTLRDYLSRCCYFMRGAPPQYNPANPPKWCPPAVLARGDWENVRPITGIVESPTMRADGSILDKPGWDEASGLLYVPNADFPAIPEAPTKEDAYLAADKLLYIIEDFPFAPTHDEHYRAAWLAGLLTALGRYAIAGPCPIFVFDANDSGTGKGLMVDAIAQIVTGREMSRSPFPDKEDELQKTITSVAMGGDRLWLFDNVPSHVRFGGSALEAVATGMTWKARILSRSKVTNELPLLTGWFATGNNMAFSDDMQRRIVRCRLQTDREHPEERDDFKEPKLLDYVRTKRAEFVVAGLTVLRAYVVAGRPKQKLRPMGSYEAWSALVQSAINWTLGLDVAVTQGEIKESDPLLAHIGTVLEGLAELPGGKEGGLTVAEILRCLNDPRNKDDYHTLRDALMEWSTSDNHLPGAKQIGNKLRPYYNRPVRGKKLLTGGIAHGGSTRWVVRAADGTRLTDEDVPILEQSGENGVK